MLRAIDAKCPKCRGELRHDIKFRVTQVVCDHCGKDETKEYSLLGLYWTWTTFKPKVWAQY